MPKFTCFLFSFLFITLGCKHPQDAPQYNQEQNSGSQVLVTDIMKAGKEFSRISKDSAFTYYSKAILLAHEYNAEEVMPEIYYYLAILYRDASDYKMATLYLDSSINKSSRINDQEWRSNAYNALGNLKFDLLDSLNARSYFDSAFHIAERYGLNRQTGVALASLAKFERNINDLIYTLNAAVELLKTDPDSQEEIAMIYVNLGLYMSNPDTAIHYFKSAIEIAEHLNSPEVIITAYNNMVYSYLDKNELGNAEACLSMHALPMALKYQNFEWLSTLYDTYADVGLAKKNTAEAFKYERLALEARGKGDKIKAIEQVRLLSSLLDLKNKELLIQKKESEIQQQENTNRQLLLWGSVLLFLLLTTSAIWIWRQQRNKIRIQGELIDSAKRLISMEEALKGRVSMELHDLVTPFYRSMLQQIEMAGINDARVEGEIKAKVTAFTSALRDMSHHLQTGFLEQITIAELINGLCDDFRKTAGLNISFSSNVDKRFSSELTVHLYRISQELLTNAFKHARNSVITVSLTQDQKTLFLMYSDTGPGFDQTDQKSDGIGTRTIMERVKLLNGKAVLNTSPGTGTEWTITVPV